ncbi:MAG: hypothetical protein CMJ72_04575 [Planctomycetaceae bacterium]|nr:hypothetical protein [Planctomycetaceae bacterium]
MAVRNFLTHCLLATLVSSAWSHQAAQAEVINWRNNVDAAKVEAGQTGRFVLLHFWTPSCGPCKVLERDVFSQPQLGAFLEKDFVPVKVNADLSPALANAYRIDQVPTDILLSPQGTPIARLNCPNTSEAYTAQLTKAAQHFRGVLAKQKTPELTPVQSAYAGLNIRQNKNTALSLQQQPVHTTGPAPSQVAETQPKVTNNLYAAVPQSTLPQKATAAPAPTATHQPNLNAATVPPRPAARVPAGAMPNSYRNQPAPANAHTMPNLATPSLAAGSPAQTSQVKTTSAESTPQQNAKITLAQQTNASPAVSHPQVAAKAKPPQLPAGAPPVAFDGYCAVSLKYEQKWISGQLEYGAYHRGLTFLFAGPEQQQKFLANPDAYCPVFSGLDVVKILEDNQQIEGSRKYGFKYMNAFYLFSSQETMSRFAANPKHYAASVRQAMTRMDTSTKETIRR